MLTTDETRQLGRFALATTASASVSGTRQARTRGFGLEFQDYRPYQPGDDPRSIDWTIDARLRQLVVRVFEADGHVRLHVLVDVSRSMTIGQPSKLACARKLAALLSYIAVERRDAVALATFDTAVRTTVRAMTGRAQLFRILDALARTEPGGHSSIDASLRGYGAAMRGPGLAVVLSDFIGADEANEGLQYLLYRGFTPVPLQVLADEDLRPPFDNDSEIVDAEDDSLPPLIVDRRAVAEYRGRMSALTAQLQSFCLSHGLPWMQVTSGLSFAELLKSCVDGGLIATRA